MRAAIAVLNGHDVVVTIATGAGKSLCYILPAICLRGLTLVISPLIALMEDQIDIVQTSLLITAICYFLDRKIKREACSGAQD